MERMESRVFFERRHSFGAGGVTTDTAPVRRNLNWQIARNLTGDDEEWICRSVVGASL